MRREDVIDLVGRIPEADHAKLQLVLRSGLAITADTFVRFEEFYLLLRGREAGNADDGRAFFVPYDELVCIKIERVMKLSEMTAMYGEEEPAGAQPAAAGAATASAITPAPVETPVPSAPLDPNEIARQNLLARIRAARTMAGAPKPAAK
jgi:hypothetical protein